MARRLSASAVTRLSRPPALQTVAIIASTSCVAPCFAASGSVRGRSLADTFWSASSVAMGYSRSYCAPIESQVHKGTRFELEVMASLRHAAGMELDRSGGPHDDGADLLVRSARGRSAITHHACTHASTQMWRRSHARVCVSRGNGGCQTASLWMWLFNASAKRSPPV